MAASIWETLAGLGAMAGGGIALATGVGAPIGLGLMGAGAGLVKSGAIDTPKADAANALSAETNRYSPLTGMKGGALQTPDPVGSSMTGGVSGAMLGQEMSKIAPNVTMNMPSPSVSGVNYGGLNYGQGTPGNFFGSQGASLASSRPLEYEAIGPNSYWNQLAKR